MLTKHLRFQSKPWWPGATEDFQEEKVVVLGRTTVEGGGGENGGSLEEVGETSACRGFRYALFRDGRAKRMKRVLPRRAESSI